MVIPLTVTKRLKMAAVLGSKTDIYFFCIMGGYVVIKKVTVTISRKRVRSMM